MAVGVPASVQRPHGLSARLGPQCSKWCLRCSKALTSSSSSSAYRKDHYCTVPCASAGLKSKRRSCGKVLHAAPPWCSLCKTGCPSMEKKMRDKEKARQLDMAYKRRCGPCVRKSLSWCIGMVATYQTP